MAAIKQRKTKYSVIYWYVNEQGERKQKWDTVDTIGEAKSRKVFVEFYQEKYGQAIVPNEETYFQRVADEKAKTGKEGGTDEHDSGSEPVRRRTPTQKSARTRLAWKPTSTALPLKMENHQQQRISAKLWQLSLRTCHLSNFQLLSPLPVSSGC